MFSRPHIEFIQSQCLPWSPAPRGIPGAECKILSRADRGGACSLLLRYPPGWQRDLTEYSPADEEFYVLEGRIEIDSQIFGADSYAFRPAGFTRRSIQSPEGCVMLAFYSREPVWLSGPGNGAAERSPRSVGFLDTATMPWDMTLNDPRLAHLGISRKNLRTDPGTGERTFLSLVLPQSAPPGGAGPQEMHPVVEEAGLVRLNLTAPDTPHQAGFRRTSRTQRSIRQMLPRERCAWSCGKRGDAGWRRCCRLRSGWKRSAAPGPGT